MWLITLGWSNDSQACQRAFQPEYFEEHSTQMRGSVNDLANLFLEVPESSMAERVQNQLNALFLRIQRINKILHEDNIRRQTLLGRWFTSLSDEVRHRYHSHSLNLEYLASTLKPQLEELNLKVKSHRRTQLRQILSEPELRRYAREALNLLWLKSIPSRQMVSLSFGNSITDPSASESHEVTTLVREITARNYKVLYDADSKLAPVIAEAAGKFGIGVSIAENRVLPKGTQGQTVLFFHNPYLKLEALTYPEVRIVDPSSVSGKALVVFGNASAVFDPHNQWGMDLEHWGAYLDRQGLNTGLKFESVPVITSAANLDLEPHETRGQLPPFIKLNELSLPGLNFTVQYVKEMAIDGSSIRNAAGAVVFGSSGLHESFIDQTYEVSRRLAELGIPVTTGGAGGMMLVANMAAFDAGGHSIGIPIAGRNQLKEETRVYSEFQTDTVPVSNYASRVGLLMQNREFVVVVPGRSGTMREVATALIELGAKSENSPKIMFVNFSYYQPMVDWLRAGNEIPAPFLRKIALIDDVSELDQHFDEDFNKKVAVEIRPRTDRIRFPHSDYEVRKP